MTEQEKIYYKIQRNTIIWAINRIALLEKEYPDSSFEDIYKILKKELDRLGDFLLENS